MFYKVKLGTKNKEYLTDGTIYYPVVKTKEMDEIGYWMEEMEPGNPESAMLVPAIDKNVMKQALTEITEEQMTSDINWMIYEAYKAEAEWETMRIKETEETRDKFEELIHEVEVEIEPIDEKMSYYPEESEEFKKLYEIYDKLTDKKAELEVKYENEMYALDSKYQKKEWWEVDENENWEETHFNPKNNPWNKVTWEEVEDTMSQYQMSKVEWIKDNHPTFYKQAFLTGLLKTYLDNFQKRIEDYKKIEKPRMIEEWEKKYGKPLPKEMMNNLENALRETIYYNEIPSL